VGTIFRGSTRTLVVALALAAAAASCASPRLPAGTVRFHHHGTTDVATGPVDRLRKIGVELLKSSSFNTAMHPNDMHESVPAIHDRYRRVVSGDCMIIGYGHPVRLGTVGGEAIVYEIIIGLSRPDYADAVFTIDDEGRIVEYGKFDGRIAVELRKMVPEPAAARQP
jgi:hypothetical protein